MRIIGIHLAFIQVQTTVILIIEHDSGNGGKDSPLKSLEKIKFCLVSSSVRSRTKSQHALQSGSVEQIDEASLTNGMGFLFKFSAEGKGENLYFPFILNEIRYQKKIFSESF